VRDLFDELDTSPRLGDVCGRKHGGNPQSVAAWEVAQLTAEATRACVLALIRDSPRGLTLDELCVLMNRDPNQLSGRCTELGAAGAIERSGEKRRTRAGVLAAVWVATGG